MTRFKIPMNYPQWGRNPLTPTVAV